MIEQTTKYFSHKYLLHINALKLISLVNQSKLAESERLDVIDSLTYVLAKESPKDFLKYWSDQRVSFLNEHYDYTGEWQQFDKGYNFKIQNSVLSICRVNPKVSDSVKHWMINRGFRLVSDAKKGPDQYDIKLSKHYGDGPKIISEIQQIILKEK